MDSILFDTNIILDIALERQPFHDWAHQLVLTALKKDVVLFITATTITDIYYIIRKTKGKESAWEFIAQLMDFVEKIDVLVTRDATGFAKAPLKVLTPEQALALLKG